MMRDRSRRRTCACILVAAAVLGAESVRAALVSQSGPFGAGTHTLDTETGLVWLDLTESTFYSHTQILAETKPGGVFEGYHLATGAEVAELFANAGIPELSTDFVPENYASVVALMNAIGVLGANGNCGDGCSFSYSAGYTDDPPHSANSFQVANLAFFDNSAGLSPSYPQAPIGRAYVGGGSSDTASAGLASFLLVPEPSDAGPWALAVLARLAKRRGSLRAHRGGSR